eukprot:m.312435 g.312435  ORF g.312435 m.312435 type:complete len:98 (+) comp27463_c0_seq13:203-496(+)
MSGSSPDEADAEADAEIPVQTALQTLYTSNSDVQEACITARISEVCVLSVKRDAFSSVYGFVLVIMELTSLAYTMAGGIRSRESRDSKAPRARVARA